MSNDFLMQEYLKLQDIVRDFDQRLLTIKGWGVTLSLASLGFGFQYQHFGLFIVAALSGLAFWATETITKKHQMRHYVRIREIEVRSFQKSENNPEIPAPQINWSWVGAYDYFRGKHVGPPPPPERYAKFTLIEDLPISAFDIKVWFYPHVLLPHVISVFAGIFFFCLGITGYLGRGMHW